MSIYMMVTNLLDEFSSVSAKKVSVEHNFPTAVSPCVVNAGLGLLQPFFQDVSVNVSSQWAAQTLKLPPPLYKSEEMRTQSKQYIVYLSNLHNPPTVFQTNSTAIGGSYHLCLLSVRFGDGPFKTIHVKPWKVSCLLF